MSKRSKRYQGLKAKISAKGGSASGRDAHVFSLAEAIEILRETANTKFDSSVELHVRTGINVKQSDQAVRGTVVMPHGTGRTQRVAVITEKADQAKAAGAALAGGEEIINAIKETGKIEFDVLVAEPAFMPKLAPIAKILGPKGLMPSPKDGTVTADVLKALADLLKGKVTFKNDDTGNIHLLVGRVSFSAEQLQANIQAAFDAVKAVRPNSIKGTYLQSITLTTTMGPGIKVDLK